MKRRIFVAPSLIVAMACAYLGGCGKSESKSAGQASATPAAPTRTVSGQSDLVGAWYTTAPSNKAELLGLEFGKDGKVMLTMPGMQTVTTDYSVIDGGRMRLVMPNRQTLVFACKVDSSSLLLEPETPGVFPKMQFTRLNGQTIAQAHKQRQEEEAKRRQKMLAAIQKQLDQSNLVLVSNDPKLHLSRYALDIKGSGRVWRGTVYSEIANPPMRRQVQVSIQQSDPPRVLVDIGHVLGPVGEADRNPMRITLTAQGAPDKLEAAGEGLVIRSDAATHDELVKKYEETAKARQALIDQFADQFQSYSTFTGQLAYPNNPNAKPREIAIGLLRVEGKPAFMVADMTRNSNPAPSAFNQPAEILLENGKRPLLVLPRMQGVLAAANSSGVITLEGKLNGMVGQLNSTRVMSKEQLEKQRAVVAEFLDKQLPAGIVLSGPEWVSGKATMPVPVSLELKGDAQHNLTGVLKALQMGGDFNVTGKIEPTLLGAVFKVEGPVRQRLKAASNQLGRTRSATVSVEWQDGQPRFISDIRGGYQTGPAELTLASPERLKSEMDKVRAALTAGCDFVLTDPSRFVRDKVNLQLKLDSTGGKVTGQSSESRYWGGGAISGELKEQDGLPYLSLSLATMKGRQGYRLPARQINLWVLFDQKGNLALSGWSLPDTSNPPMIEVLKLSATK